ncbi:HTH_48 domain-containing protein [Nephila pilipes]|uniref:HTH_48 domain-containing protein n=1 Tax=Nephila pilipes TaxID=299642 RepID=A0A8X6PID6_NEPPI|nr:HTH_48 domain-containing protein [Nephila pilipes]
MLLREAYGDNTMSQNIVYRWHKMSRVGGEDTEVEDRSGRPKMCHSDQNVKKVRDMLNSDRRLNVRILEDECNIRKSTVHRIVTKNSGMRNIRKKLVPKVLSDK